MAERSDERGKHGEESSQARQSYKGESVLGGASDVLEGDKGCKQPKPLVINESLDGDLLAVVTGKQGDFSPPVITFTEEGMKALSKPYLGTIVLKVLGKRFSYIVLAHCLKKIWWLKGSYEIMEPWSASFQPNEASFGTTPVWIQIASMNIRYYHEKAMRRIASGIGCRHVVTVSEKVPDSCPQKPPVPTEGESTVPIQNKIFEFGNASINASIKEASKPVSHKDTLHAIDTNIINEDSHVDEWVQVTRKKGKKPLVKEPAKKATRPHIKPNLSSKATRPLTKPKGFQCSSLASWASRSKAQDRIHASSSAVDPKLSEKSQAFAATAPSHLLFSSLKVVPGVVAVPSAETTATDMLPAGVTPIPCQDRVFV
ncbi:hypothetical protein PIB30_086264 [Stylosanthes scabra]|uniref:DUF4283 domain-containing protein n=1 Tax=Stylosanthes scabra TaxID=79078 RepID=A0ABU6VV20_9FABA|nr:hypothetical protein [Stylosanthes scabra]